MFMGVLEYIWFCGFPGFARLCTINPKSAVKAHPGLRASEIIAQTGVKNKAARVALYRLEGKELLVKKDGKWSLLG